MDDQHTAQPDAVSSAREPAVAHMTTSPSPPRAVSAPPDSSSAMRPTAAPAPNSDDDDEVIEQVAPEAAPVEEDEHWWDLKMVWAGKTYELRVGGNDLIYDFRAQVDKLTGVPPEGQKLIGLTRGKLPASSDGERFASLALKPGPLKFTMVGTPVDQRFKDPVASLAPADGDADFDVKYPVRLPAGAQLSSLRQPVKDGKIRYGVSPADDPRNVRKVAENVEQYKVDVMNPPREGKGLLVLDLDYTMVDTKPMIDGALPSIECARPGLHDFLTVVYPYYDIVVWSQTHWMWLETKLVELGVVGEDRPYKICCVADRRSMFPRYQHEVKPLSYLWAQFPQWSARNTIHIDDLSRNFAMNPGEGLRGAGTDTGAQDRELYRLAVYLLEISAEHRDAFVEVDHELMPQDWKKVAARAMKREKDNGTHWAAWPQDLRVALHRIKHGGVAAPGSPTAQAMARLAPSAPDATGAVAGPNGHADPDAASPDHPSATTPHPDAGGDASAAALPNGTAHVAADAMDLDGVADEPPRDAGDEATDAARDGQPRT